ncbi:GNAT family N-acetyltransferase [Streptomyces sp. NPDC016845]|uniref:GNAT family N-acetyltransferase n=1 Tax=Streptomyces sp. NPDC016845 TaxID=3364972 RepID=UPI00378B2EF1
MILEPLDPGPDHALPGELLTEVTEVYAANREFFALSGDFPDPDAITGAQVAVALADELAQPGAEVLLARAGGRLVGLTVTLAHHPHAAERDDPDPWIGLLMIAADRQRQGYGRELAGAVEDRFREAGRTGVRLAVLDANPEALAFWTALGYEEIARRPDLQLDRPCRVLRKPLAR